MAMKKETQLRLKIKKALQKAFPGSKWVTMVASPWSEAGISDLIGCVQGLFIALEVKQPTGTYRATPAQLRFIIEIQQASGEATVVKSVDEAVEFVRKVVSERF
jgi:hypothetical protein